jgi:hypothetical protein
MLWGTGGAVMVLAYWFGVGSLSVLFFVTAQQQVTVKAAVSRHVAMMFMFFFIVIMVITVFFDYSVLNGKDTQNFCTFAA